MDDFLVFGSPLIGDEEIVEAIDCLKSGWIGTGPRVAKFEKMFKQYIGCKNAAALNSCTAALHTSMIATNLAPGSEVITTAMTFCATINAIIHAGLKPVLVDIDPATKNINVSKIEEKINRNTGAILPVHFAGHPCDMDGIMQLAKQYNLVVIEDCAHAIEAKIKDKRVGTYGDFGCYSFYVTKNITTVEGGMVISRKEEHTERIKRLALHGMSADAWGRYSDKGFKHYKVVECGFKYNMTDLHASLGLVQLKNIDRYWQRRQQIWNYYCQDLKDLPLKLPYIKGGVTHAYHLFIIEIDKEESGISQNEFIKEMTNNKIGVGVHYLSIPEHPFYQSTFGWKVEDYPVANKFGRSAISIPLSPKLSDYDVRRVCSTIKNILLKQDK